MEPPRWKRQRLLRDGLFLLVGELTTLMVKQQLVFSAVARSPDGRLYIMFGPVITS